MAIKENMDLYRCEKCKKLYTSEYAANIVVSNIIVEYAEKKHRSIC